MFNKYKYGYDKKKSNDKVANSYKFKLINTCKKPF